MAEIFRQRVTRDFGDRARHFHAGRSASNDDERHRCFTRSFVRNFFGVFERHQNAAPNFNRVFQALQTGGESFPFRVSKIGMPRAGRENEIIVIEIAIDHLHFPGVHVDGFHFGEDYLHVFAFAQNRAHRGGDVGRRKRRRRDLIKQWLK